MFGVGFSELLVVAVIALLVLGPERLPKAARFAGLWVRRARAQWYSVKSELEREMASEELRRTLANPISEFQEATREAQLSLNEAARSARDATKATDDPGAVGSAAPKSPASAAEAMAEPPAKTVPPADNQTPHA